MNKPFAARIAGMNAMYKLPACDTPTVPADVADRLVKFKATLMDEVHEIDEIVVTGQRERVLDLPHGDAGVEPPEGLRHRHLDRQRRRAVAGRERRHESAEDHGDDAAVRVHVHLSERQDV